MSVKRRLIAFLLFLSCLALLAFGFHTALRGNPLGADFYTAWKTARAVLIDNRSPYDPTIAREIQIDIQGRLSQPDEDQLAYSYPLFGLLIIAPLAFLAFDWAQALWLAFNFLLALVIGLAISTRKRLWLGATFWLPYPVSFALILGNFDLLMAVIWLFFLGQTLAQKESRGTDSIGLGLLVAITTLKPQFSWLFLIYAFVRVLKLRTWKLAGGFLAGLALLWLVPLLWRPDWISQWLNQIQLYMKTMGGRFSLLNDWMGLLPSALAKPFAWIGLSLLAGFSIYLFLLAWRGRISGLCLLAWCGVVTYLVHPTGLSYEQMTFLLPLFLWAVRERQMILSALVWFGFILLSWLSLLATLTKLDPLADSSWLLIAAFLWLGWLLARRRMDPRLGV